MSPAPRGRTKEVIVVHQRTRAYRFRGVLALTAGCLLGMAPTASAAPVCPPSVASRMIAFGRFDPALGDFSM